MKIKKIQGKYPAIGLLIFKGSITFKEEQNNNYWRRKKNECDASFLLNF